MTLPTMQQIELKHDQTELMQPLISLDVYRREMDAMRSKTNPDYMPTVPPTVVLTTLENSGTPEICNASNALEASAALVILRCSERKMNQPRPDYRLTGVGA